LKIRQSFSSIFHSKKGVLATATNEKQFDLGEKNGWNAICLPPGTAYKFNWQKNSTISPKGAQEKSQTGNQKVRKKWQRKWKTKWNWEKSGGENTKGKGFPGGGAVKTGK